jgi:hypothetical protein
MKIFKKTGLILTGLTIALGILVISCVIVALTYECTMAAEGGYSNYVPGTYGDFAAAVEPPTKFTIRNDIYYYQADINRSVRSGLLETDADLEFIMDFLTLLYKPDFEILGASYAFGAFIPFAHIDIETGISQGSLRVSRQEDVFGLGDIAFIPAILFWNYGNFHFTFSESIVTPTGSYDTDDLANTGLNYWTFDTNAAVTYLNEETGQDYSVNGKSRYRLSNRSGASYRLYDQSISL